MVRSQRNEEETAVMRNLVAWGMVTVGLLAAGTIVRCAPPRHEPAPPPPLCECPGTTTTPDTTPRDSVPIERTPVPVTTTAKRGGGPEGRTGLTQKRDIRPAPRPAPSPTTVTNNNVTNVHNHYDTTIEIDVEPVPVLPPEGLTTVPVWDETRNPPPIDWAHYTGRGGVVTRSDILGARPIVAVPEPTTMSLLGLGLCGVVLARRRRR